MCVNQYHFFQKILLLSEFNLNSHLLIESLSNEYEKNFPYFFQNFPDFTLITFLRNYDILLFIYKIAILNICIFYTLNIIDVSCQILMFYSQFYLKNFSDSLEIFID